MAFSYARGIPFGDLTRDPTSLLKASKSYHGALSNIGILFWCFATAITYFTFLLLRSVTKTDNHIEKKFLLWSGIISTILLLDDFFLLHEKAFVALFGFKEKVTFSVYGLIVIFYLLRFKKFILKKTPYLFLLSSFSFFALSILFDFLPRFSTQWHHVFEDVPKLFGIVSWFSYHLITADKIHKKVYAMK